jgi:hypothetical protein
MDPNRDSRTKATFISDEGQVLHGAEALTAFDACIGPSRIRAKGRAPRPSTSSRTRGSRRGVASGSKARDGPSSDDDPPPRPHIAVHRRPSGRAVR